MVNDDPRPTCACSDSGREPSGTLENRPGLPTVAYRIGTHASFSRQMVEQIQKFASRPELEPDRAGPATADPRDPAIGILDAFAVVCDVLAFYQERYANEGFLRTATERRSVLELAAAVGYELDAGLAAQSRVAFFVDESALAPAVVSVPAQTPIGSVPGQGEKPVTYETLEELSARAAWNAMQASSGKPQSLTANSWAALQGTNLRLEVGDVLAFSWGSSSAQSMVATVRTVRVELGRAQTLIAWSRLAGATSLPAQPHVFVFRLRASVFGHNAPDPKFVYSGAAADPAVKARTILMAAAPSNQETSAINQTKGSIKTEPRADAEEWPGFDLVEPRLDLDNAYPKVRAQTPLVLVDGANVRLAQLDTVRLGAQAAFAISSKTTHLTLVRGTPTLDKFGRRSTTVYLEPEELALAEALEASPVQGARIRLDRAVPPLPRKRMLIVQGQRAARVAREGGLTFSPFGAAPLLLRSGEWVQVLEEPKAGADGTLRFVLADVNGFIGDAIGVPGDIERSTELVGEVVSVLDCTVGLDGRTEITLSQPLEHEYDRRSCRIYGNIAPASHGETVPAEVLGSGDAAQELQRFSLRKKPLTRVWSNGVAQSSLRTRVNGVLWTELPSLFGANRKTESYELSTSDDATTTLLFGLDAAHLPTGSENVVASYRVGVGVAAAVRAGQLSVLKGPVLGLQRVTNPLPAEGGADPESLSEARYNAALRVTTLDRIVSLQDFEDFVRALPGVAKASANAIWSGTTRLVHISVALATGLPLALGSDLERDLRLAVQNAGGFGQPFVLRGFSPARFGLSAALLVDPRHTPELVLEGARERLLEAFAFAARALSQPVTATEVLGLLQAFPGVQAVRLVALERTDAGEGRAPAGVDGILPALPARFDPDLGVLPAELLSIDPASLTLTLGAP